MGTICHHRYRPADNGYCRCPAAIIARPQPGWEAWLVPKSGLLLTGGIGIWLLGGVFSFYRSPGRKALERKLEQADKRIAALTKQVSEHETSYKSLLQQQLKLIYDDLKFGHTERISLYRHDGRAFVPLARYAGDPAYKQFGRRLYPDNEGCIGKAYHEGESFVSNLPNVKDDALAYFNVLRDHYQIPRKTAKSFSMKSRSLAAHRIDDHHGQILAVIVFESLEPDSVLDREKLQQAMVRESQNLRGFLEQMTQTLPVPLAVREEGY